MFRFHGLKEKGWAAQRKKTTWIMVGRGRGTEVQKLLKDLGRGSHAEEAYVEREVCYGRVIRVEMGSG